MGACSLGHGMPCPYGIMVEMGGIAPPSGSYQRKSRPQVWSAWIAPQNGTVALVVRKRTIRPRAKLPKGHQVAETNHQIKLCLYDGVQRRREQPFFGPVRSVALRRGRERRLGSSPQKRGRLSPDRQRCWQLWMCWKSVTRGPAHSTCDFLRERPSKRRHPRKTYIFGT